MPLPNGLYFSAPLDFDKSVWREFGELLPSVRIRHDATVWVCDPKADFVIDEKVLRDYWRLKILATPSTGTNHIDLEACKRRGVKVLSLLDDRKGLDTISASAEFTFKLLIDALRIPPARELQGKTVGLVGYGRIGKRIHKWCKAFNAPTLIHDIYVVRRWKNGLSSIFQEADAVIICCALTDATRGMIDAKLLRSMKHGAALVNTARGEIINEQDLYTVLMERPDIRFATDVVHGEVEGRGEESREKLRALGAIVTPHIAGETFDSRTKAARIILELLKKELNDEKEKTGRNHV